MKELQRLLLFQWLILCIYDNIKSVAEQPGFVCVYSEKLQKAELIYTWEEWFMERNEKGGMYGAEGRYHGALPEGFGEHVWIELIGFDNESADYGVSDLLQTMGFVPDAFLFLVTSVDFIHDHTGMEEEYELDPFFCSYAGHEYNDERARQKWTNHQFRGLVEVLHARGVKCYLSVFDLLRPGSVFAGKHPEMLRMDWADGRFYTSRCVYATKTFADGSCYGDYLLDAGKKTLTDYGFDGIHLADGLSRPRQPIQTADLSDGPLESAGIRVPADADRSRYIAEHYRREWIAVCTDRWMGFLEKVIPGFHEAGFSVIVNNAWQKDPMEALYRYGVDYNRLAKLPVDSIVIENGAPTNALLDDAANAGYHQSYEDRKLVHHYLRAALMMEAACFQGKIPIRPLYPVRDTMEQYDVIHHMPTALTRHSGAVFNSYLWNADGTLSHVIRGNTYCLGDGLKADDWRFLRLCGDNAFIREPVEVKGVTVVWSWEKTLREMEALISHRTWSSVKWVAELMRRGAPVTKAARIDCLETVQGDILVPNPDLLSEEEREKISSYKNGRVIYIKAPAQAEALDYSGELNPVGIGFPYPLLFEPVEEQVLEACAEEICQGQAYVSVCAEECHVQEVRTEEKTSTFLVENEEFYYAVPIVCTGRKIKSAKELTKLTGYRVRVAEDTFRTLVPLRGMAIVEVEFV